MAENRYAAPNNAEREHMAAVARRLTDRELAAPVGKAGWTVAGLYAHMAFWDLRALHLLGKWKTGGPGDSPIDTDVVNEATREICLALTPREAVRVALDAAERIDREIAGLAPSFLADVESRGMSVRLDRSAHRKHHLARIEAAHPA